MNFKTLCSILSISLHILLCLIQIILILMRSIEAQILGCTFPIHLTYLPINDLCTVPYRIRIITFELSNLSST